MRCSLGSAALYWFPLDHLQRLVVILYYDMSAVYVRVKLFKAKYYWETFSFYISLSGFHISKCFASKCYGPVVLNKSSAKAIFTGIGLQDEGLGMVVVCEGGLEKHVAYPKT